MRFKQIIENTTAGSVATVAQPMMTQTRENTNVRGLEPVQKVMKGTAKKKGPYANSISEGKVKELAQDLKNLTSHQFQEKYKQSKAEVKADMKKVNEDDLSEQDLIVIPGQGRLRGTGFTKHDPDRAEHEGQTLKNSLHTIIRLATHLDKELTVRDNFPEWVSEKVGSIKGDMLAVMNYIISSQEMQHDTDAMESSRQWSNKDMEKLRVATRDFDDIMASDGPEAFKQELIKKRIQTKPMAGPKGVLPEGSQRVDSIVTDALRVMKGPEISDAVLALKRVLGDRAYNERRGFYNFYIDQIHDMYNQQNINELSSSLLGKAAQVAKNKSNQAMEPEIHNALGGGYMNPLANHYDTVSQKMSNRSAQVGKKEAIRKIASPAVMRKMGITEGDVSTGNLQTMYNLARMAKNYCSDPEGKEALTELLRILKWYMDQAEQGVAEGKIDFAKKLQGKVDKHNKAVVKTKQAVGSRVADIGAGGKEHNEKTDAAWDAAKAKVNEGAKVDRMVKHVKQSEKKLGRSDKEAENIAWATANKRGMLDNKNKKK